MSHLKAIHEQNMAQMKEVAPHLSTSEFNADTKCFDGDVVIAMRSSLSGEPLPRFDLLVIDEAHHVPCDQYTDIITRCRDSNPNMKVLGMTATPNRGDKKGMVSQCDTICMGPCGC